MSAAVSLLNDVAVSLFGSILAASFCGALDSRRNRVAFWCCMVVIPLASGWIYATWDGEFLRMIYPLIIHLPLILLMSSLTERTWWSAVSVLTAYLCCQLRRWLALFVVTLASGDHVMQDVVELVVTLPLLVLLLRFAAPSIRRLADHSIKLKLVFGVIPTVYYVFDYATVVYTDILTSGRPVVVEFMPFVCCGAYLAFLLYYVAEEEQRNRLQQLQNGLGMQVTQAVREIDALRQSQKQASAYRHDLRHHLQYLAGCIEEGQTERAQAYISGICAEIEAQKVQWYCENDTANLILSAFAQRASRDGISLNAAVTLPPFLLISDSDLCVLLSNALENALHACQNLPVAETPPVISVGGYEQDSRLFLQVANPCAEPVRFENGVPISNRPGHGLGVQSICAIVKRYGGICSFSANNGIFLLRLSL